MEFKEIKRIVELVSAHELTEFELDDQGVRRILLRNYGQLFEWVWPSASAIDEAFMHPPTILPYDPIEPQGESICYTLNNGFSVMSEKVDTVFPIIYQYSLK